MQSMGPQSTIVCPFCQTLLSYPSGVGVIQCPTCQNTIDLNSPAMQGNIQQPLGMSLSQLQMLQNQQQVGGQLQTRCNQCSSLLAYPASSLLVQCPQCGKTQDPRQNGFYNPMMGPMMMNSPMVSHQQVGGKFSPAGPGSGQKPLKKRKDPNAPKAVRNAYMIFCQQQRAKLKATNPELSFGKLGGKMGEQWRTMSPEEKKPYEKLAMEDRERYRSEMLRFQQTGNCKPAGEPSTKRVKPEGADVNEASSSPSVPSHDLSVSVTAVSNVGGEVGGAGEDSKVAHGDDFLNSSDLVDGDDDSRDLDGEDAEGDSDGGERDGDGDGNDLSRE